MKNSKAHLKKFIRSGFKYKYFSNDLYEMLYLHANVFIAHFDKAGFYNRRFNNDADITIQLLKCVKNPSLKSLCLNLASAMEDSLITEKSEQIICSVTKGA